MAWLPWETKGFCSTIRFPAAFLKMSLDFHNFKEILAEYRHGSLVTIYLRQTGGPARVKSHEDRSDKSAAYGDRQPYSR
ncbi:hypothetical protein [Rhizobium bangladeshense]|uniref:hypothetical protein n=1 Tax=Rhizobium bangladeshense TaxID=1138189 RepID=UPI0018D3B642|nr:hypothetical protein [Rhizobium bangladeshense]